MCNLNPKDYMILKLGFKTIIVPSSKISNLILFLNECFEVDRNYDKTDIVYTVNGNVNYSIETMGSETTFE